MSKVTLVIESTPDQTLPTLEVHYEDGPPTPAHAVGVVAIRAIEKLVRKKAVEGEVGHEYEMGGEG